MVPARLLLSLQLVACALATRTSLEEATSSQCTIKSTKDELSVSFPLSEDKCEKDCKITGNWHTDTKETVSGLHAVTVQHFSAVFETKVTGQHCSCTVDGTELVKYRLKEQDMKVSSNSWSAKKDNCEKNDDLAKMVCWNWYHKGFVATLEVDPHNTEALRMQANSDNLRMGKFLADKDENAFCVPCEGASCHQHTLPPMIGQMSQEVNSLLTKGAFTRPIQEYVETLPAHVVEAFVDHCTGGVNLLCAQQKLPKIPKDVVRQCFQFEAEVLEWTCGEACFLPNENFEMVKKCIDTPWWDPEEAI